MNPPEAWPLVVPGLALAVPATFALAALLPGRARFSRHAARMSGVALGLALCLIVATLAWEVPPRAGALRWVRVDALTCVMLLLVCSIGAIIARYSRTYLEGDPGLNRYFRWLLVTLSAVTALVVANNLLVVAAAWTATSLALHQLLTFYSDRQAGLVVAHKKFLVSRLADVCLWTSLALVHSAVGSLDLDRIASWVAAHPALSPSMQLAAVLLVITVALKSAQLPFHGWLIQVMEAPTPVSALLHAGIVNIGGFVMIRLAPWMAQAASAQLLLVVLGLTTAVIAALVMTTRISVKVALAWSTCAQMGFMLVQCGLGAWHLALLHLVAHSLYKAHAFLGAGAAVEGWEQQAMTPPLPPPSSARLGLGVVATLCGAALGLAVLAPQLAGAAGGELSVPVLSLLVALALVPLLTRPGPAGLAGLAAGAARGLGVALLSFGWHVAAARLVPSPPLAAAAAAGWILVGVGFAALFAVKTTLAMAPQGRLARALYPWLFAGLYLDERFTRLTFRIWPPRLLPPQDRRVLDLLATWRPR
jgi:NAD(P)H-quinone oxidoreductase subunit 5